MGQIMNVEKIVAGTISKVGNTFSSSIRVIDISSGSIDKIISFDYTGPIEELLKRGIVWIIPVSLFTMGGVLY